MYIKAKFEGHCYMCQKPIKIGSLMSWRPGKKAMHRSCKLNLMSSERNLKESYYKSSVKDTFLDLGIHSHVKRGKNKKRYVDVRSETLKNLSDKFKENYKKAISSSKVIKKDKDLNNVKQILI